MHSCGGAGLREAEAVLCTLVSSAFWTCVHLFFCVCLARKFFCLCPSGSVSSGLFEIFLSLCSPCPPLSKSLPAFLSLPVSEGLCQSPHASFSAPGRVGSPEKVGRRRGRRRRTRGGERAARGDWSPGRRERGRERSPREGGEGGAGSGGGERSAPAPSPPPPPRPLGAGPGEMGWPGGSPCCCPAPPRPRPAGRPPQVSGRAAPGGRAAACASRPGGQCRGRSPGGAGPPGGRVGAGSGAGALGQGPGAGSRGAGGGSGRGPKAGKVTRGRGRPAVTPQPGSLAFAGPGRTRRRSVPPRTRSRRPRRPGTWAGTGRGECESGFCYFTSHLGKPRQIRLPPSILQVTLGTLAHPAFPPCLLPWASPLLAAGLPAAHPTTAISRKGECWVEGFIQTNPGLGSKRGPGSGRD